MLREDCGGAGAKRGQGADPQAVGGEPVGGAPRPDRPRDSAKEALKLVDPGCCARTVAGRVRTGRRGPIAKRWGCNRCESLATRQGTQPKRPLSLSTQDASRGLWGGECEQGAGALSRSDR